MNIHILSGTIAAALYGQLPEADIGSRSNIMVMHPPVNGQDEKTLNLDELSRYECIKSAQAEMLKSLNAKLESESFSLSRQFGYIYRFYGSYPDDGNGETKLVLIIWTSDGAQCQTLTSSYDQ